MGWGAPFKAAWDGATSAGKAAANAVSSTARYAYDAVKRGAIAAKDAAVAGAKAVESTARHSTRDAVRAIGDSAIDGLASGAETAKKVSNAAKNAYNKVREALGSEPASSPAQSCPYSQTKKTPVTDKDRDGWMMAPQGPGKPCKAIPPDKDSLSKARSQAVGSQSECCRAKRAAGMPPRDIIYVNGIKTDRATHCFTLNAIASQTCARVVGVYNATEGMPSDAIQTGQDRLLIKAAAGERGVPSQDGRNPAVDTMARQVGSALRNGETPEVWAHSQGGAVLSLALYEAKQDRMIATGNPDPLKGMKVKSFGSASPKWTDGPKYEHYVHVNDATPSLFGLGHAASEDTKNAGAGAKIIRFSGDPKGGDFVRPAQKEWYPTPNSNHGIEDTYLKMEKQTNGGCP